MSAYTVTKKFAAPSAELFSLGGRMVQQGEILRPGVVVDCDSKTAKQFPLKKKGGGKDEAPDDVSSD